MTPSEFKSWFQGYTENITKLPTAVSNTAYYALGKAEATV